MGGGLFDMKEDGNLPDRIYRFVDSPPTLLTAGEGGCPETCTEGCIMCPQKWYKSNFQEKF